LSAVAHVGFVQSSYVASETDRRQQVCIEVFNPPPEADLALPITLVYETRTNTAGESTIVSSTGFEMGYGPIQR
jgi:hypothetical protein